MGTGTSTLNTAMGTGTSTLNTATRTGISSLHTAMEIGTSTLHIAIGTETRTPHTEMGTRTSTPHTEMGTRTSTPRINDLCMFLQECRVQEPGTSTCDAWVWPGLFLCQESQAVDDGDWSEGEKEREKEHRTHRLPATDKSLLPRPT